MPGNALRNLYECACRQTVLCSGSEPFLTASCRSCDGLFTGLHADPLLLERLAQMETEFGSKSPTRDADGNVKKKTEDAEDEDEDEPIEEDEDDYQDDDDYYQVRPQQAVALLHIAYTRSILG